MTKTIITILFLTLNTVAFSQQDPQYTQYMYNQAIINPAYAGSNESLSLVSLYRNQWTGFEGAPKTLTVSAHTPSGKNTGIGISFISDQLGPVKENNIYADFSYTINLGNSSKLAFGIKAGITLHDIALNSGVVTFEPGDPLFSRDVSKVNPNVGFGSFLYSDNYYVGLSVPNILNSTHLDSDGINFGNETQHYFFTSGYVFQLSKQIKFKPSFLIKSSFDSPVSFDINANFLFYDRFELGTSYRNIDSFSGLIGFFITKNIRLGYAYDHIISDLKIASTSSHEVFLVFDFNIKNKVSRSPRFF
jgi:type IX secretion system PorP/SprF family membrane protein